MSVPSVASSSRARFAAPILAVAPAALLALVWVVPEREADRLTVSLLLLGMGLGLLHLFPKHRAAALLVAVVASVRYLGWRATATLPADAPGDVALGALLFATEVFGFLVLLGGSFQTAVRRERTPVPLDRFDPAALPHVDVLVPTYDEGVDILRRTLTGATRLAYPNRTIHVLDDGRRPEVAALAAELGCAYLTRPDNRGAKAGNLNHALARTSGELVAVFDADHVPVSGFLDATVGFFLEDPKVALVQTPHHFYNADPFERNLRLGGRVPPEQAFFYHRVQKGADAWNAAFFCGSCAVLRRDALAEVGGIAQTTVTEDAHTAMRLHGRGWRSVYLDLPLAAGLATERFAWHVAQRTRWTRGMIQILRLDSPLLARGLSLPQRLCYLVAAAHFLFGLPRLVYLLAPAAWLLLGVHPIDAAAADLLVYALPHLALAVAVSGAANANARHSFWPEVYETALAPWAAVVAVVTWIAPRHGRFNVTPKGAPAARAHLDVARAAPLVGLLAVVVAAGVVAPLRIAAAPDAWDHVLLASAWNAWNFVLLAAAAAVCLEPAERRRGPRLPVEGDVTLHGDGVVVSGALLDLSESGARARFPLGTSVPDAPRLGLAYPAAAGVPAASPAAPFGATVLARRATPDGLEVTFGFPALEPAARAAVLARMFAPADRWTGDRFAPDRPFRAALGVLAAPWRVLWAFLWGAPTPRAARRAARATAPAPLGAWRVAACACGRPAFPGARRCVSCGAALDVPPPTPLPVPDGRARAFAAAVPLAAAALLALRPVAAAPPPEPRAAVLSGVHDELARLRWEARVLALTAAPPSPVFEKRLWAVAHVLDAPDARPDEAPLRDALAALRGAARALGDGASPAAALATADAALSAAEPAFAGRRP